MREGRKGEDVEQDEAEGKSQSPLRQCRVRSWRARIEKGRESFGERERERVT